MALFPKCSFNVLVSGGLVVPGARLDGVLVVDAPEPIPRAEHIELVFKSTAWAGYGSGKNRRVVRRAMWIAPFKVDVHASPMPAGEHRFPFSVDVPGWLPPGFRGSDCGIDHAIEVRLDVDWALDPTLRVIPLVTQPPREGVRAPLTVRSYPGFHDSIVLEVTLASSVIAHDEPLRGHVALRSGHGARFDAVELAFLGQDTIVMGQGDARAGGSSSLRIPAEALRGGEAVPFEFPPNQYVLPSFKSAFIEHGAVMRVSADVPWSIDPKFDLPLELLPAGSTIHGETNEAVVGGERLRRIAAAMAEATGLRAGRAPMLAEGNVGPVTVRIADAPHDSRLGLQVDLTFPDVELGIDFRPLGMLDGFRSSPLLPTALRDKYLLRCKPIDARAPHEDEAIARVLGLMLSDLETAAELRLSDHHLGARFILVDDGGERMVNLARATHEKAKTIAEAIGHLPFPTALEGARAAWEATAAEQGATLVPSGPTLHGVSMRARVLTGEERAITMSIRTAWTKSGPATIVDVDLRGARLPKGAWAELESGASEGLLRPTHAVFPAAHVQAQGDGVTLERPGATSDPRTLLSAVESFFGWVLDVRGERRVDAPYR